MASVEVAARAELLEDDFVDELRLLAPQEPRQPSRFSDEITESDKTFDQMLDFDGATFEKDVTLRNCRFLRGFSFKGATFKGKVVLSGCSVTSAKGNKSAFDGATFEKSFKAERQSAFYLASFVGAQFKQSANFKGSRFYGSAKFDGAHFLQPASFASAKFNGAGTFVESAFHKTANFDAAKFKYSISHARFRAAVFKELATFDDTEFSGSADFARANFLRGVTFNSARFCIVTRETEADAEAETTTTKASGDLTVNFAEARFSSDDTGTIATFERTRFGDHNYRRDVVFDGALFTCARDGGQCSPVVFKNIETLGHFSMRSTFFRRGVNVDFSSARLEGDLDLTDAEFDGDAYFQKARISGSVSLAETQFQHYPDFRQVTFSHYPQLHLSKLPPEKYVPSERKDTALKIGALRRIAARTDDKATEQLLLVKELKLAGGVATRIYGLLSNYGRSWSRPAMALLAATVVIYPALYLGVAGLLPTTREQATMLAAYGIPCKGGTEGSAMAAAVEYSLRNALIVGAENETRSQAIQGCLAQEARANGSSLGRSLLETSQVLITLLLAFFVGAAVRLRLQLR
ncbi:MAG: pentapeptide repeat-containing protein [Hyphomicrobiaceae bacterium]|nr:pentapeptide repeat-containing protein [Hyphomicrobiaceae bacterium]